jgi:hypothetical protein
MVAIEWGSKLLIWNPISVLKYQFEMPGTSKEMI